MISTLDLEQVLKLIFERNRYLHELNTLATQWTKVLERVDIIQLPFVNALATEDIPTLRTFFRVFQQVLADLAYEVVH